MRALREAFAGLVAAGSTAAPRADAAAPGTRDVFVPGIWHCAHGPGTI